MPRAHRALTVASALAGAALLLSTPTWADAAPAPAPDIAQSEQLAARAFEAYQRKDFQSAILLYQQAFEAAPSADIVYNMARVYDNGLRDRELAISFYRRYVDDPGAVPSRIETANRRVTELEAADRAAVAPSKPPALPPMAPAPVVTRPAVAATEDSSSALTTSAIVAGSVGLVGVGFGVGFGLAAKSDLDESRRYCDGNQCTSQRGVEAAKSAKRAANVATIGFSVGGALLALGTVLWILDDGGREQPELADGFDWSPHVGPGELSLSFSGSFGGL